MKKIGIGSDSTCDLSRELLERYDITILPLHIILEDQEYRDGADIDYKDIYAWADKVKKTPKTSAFSPAEAEEYLKQRMQEYEEFIFFTISESMSSSCSVMKVTAESMGIAQRVHVVDSKNLSTGIGLLVIEAAILAKEAGSAKEVVDRILELRPRVRASFVVDTLTYLYRGGRCSGTAALLGSTLQLHPCIEVKDGSMQVGKKYRGRIGRVVRDYVNDRKDGLSHAKKDRVFITHSGSEDEVVEAARAELEGLGYFDEVLITRAGGVVSSHCGPGTLGVLYIDNAE